MENKIECVEDLVGKTITDARQTERYGNDCLEFTLDSGVVCRMYHYQDCCEHVSIEEIHGDLQHLVGSPLIMSEETSNYEEASKHGDGYDSWTFYRFATIKGYVTVRWYGSSNGYYSTNVDFEVGDRRMI
jgi:hypothetical protein